MMPIIRRQWRGRQRLLRAAMVAALLVPTGAGAQREVRMADVGSRVRVGVIESPRLSPDDPLTPQLRIRGTIHEIAPDTLYLEVSNTTSIMAIPRIRIQVVELSLRVSRRGSAVESGFTGGSILALLGPLVNGTRETGAELKAAAAGAALGFVGGALLGALYPFERWRIAWLPD
jgi:hypothetical protein